MAAEAPQTLEYRGGQLNAAPVLKYKPKLRPTKDFKAQYNKVKARLAFLISNTLALKASIFKNKGLITEAYEWDKEEVSSNDNEMVEVKVLMELAKDNNAVSKEADDTKVSIPGVERPWLSEAEGFILPNHDTGRILPTESQRNRTDPPVAVTDSSATDYDSVDESLTIKSILRSKLTFKDETLKGVIMNEPSSAPSAPARGNKSSSASKVNSAPACKLKSVKIKDDPPLAIVMKELNNLKLQISKNRSSYTKKNQPQQPGPKVVFGDDSTCITEGYGSIKCNGIVFTKFDEKRGTIFNSKKEVVMISLRASSIKKCLHVLHIDLFGPVTPRSINHEKYTLVIADEYSRYTWNTIPIPNPSLSIPSMVTLAPRDRWSQDKQIELVNITVPTPYGKTIIGSKWIFKNKRDETRVVVKNKARLVAQGYNQQEGIDYYQTFDLVVRLKVIKIFLAFVTGNGYHKKDKIQAKPSTKRKAWKS
nr:copia protein [Tanacetum cinerariifolium]